MREQASANPTCSIHESPQGVRLVISSRRHLWLLYTVCMAVLAICNATNLVVSLT